MKFTNGYWVTREGVTVHGAAELRDVRATELGVTFTVSPFAVHNRGQTLGGPLITFEISSPRPNVLGVKAYHFKGGLPKSPVPALHTEPVAITVTEDENAYTVTAGAMSAVVSKGDFALAFYHKERLLTRSDYKQLAYITAPDGVYMRERLSISVGELFYGLGERFTPFVKNGQSVETWNEDGGTASEIAYKSIPFCLSNRGYGVYVNDPGRVSFEIASEAVSKNQFSVPGEVLEYYICGGDHMADALCAYTALTGRAPMVPDWSFGLWLSTSFTTSYDEATVMSFIDGMQERGIPLSVFHFDCFWMREYEWCGFEWDASQFPDPAGLLRRIRDKGLKICVWINPYIGQKSSAFDEAMAGGYLVKRGDGSVWQWDMWQPGMGLVDFTNPEAVAWYQGKLAALLDMGVDCFKTDFGERIPTDVVWHDGSDPVGMHNYYTILYNQTVYNLLAEKRGLEDAVVFARSAWTGGQSLPVHWGGDCFATYESMAESLRGGLSLALCGFAFWSHDIGGFESTATADLYKRWSAFGLLSTHSRLHGSSSYRVPWLFDEEAVAVLRHFVSWKERLMPYLRRQSEESCRRGLPVMRPMVLAFPEDPVCATLDRQYMLGDSLLVAPIFREDGLCEFYLPEGNFTHLFTGETLEGGRFYKKTYDYFSLPLYVREGGEPVLPPE